MAEEGVKRRTWRRLLRLFMAGAYSLVGGVLLAELTLRWIDYRFSPIVFVRPDNADDHRPFHMGGRGLLTRASPLTIPDSDLLWRPDPRVSRELTPEGFRGRPPSPRAASTRLIVALGDSNTLGPLDTAAHWPGILEDLLGGPHSSHHVVNAGVYGYSSFQGLRRYHQIARYSPAVVYFCFGANDAQPVSRTDAEYALNLDAARAWEGWRLGPPLAHLWWSSADSFRSRRSATFRVPLRDYRANLRAFVDDARRRGILPILVTRPFIGSSDDPANLLKYLPSYNQTVRDVATETGIPLLDAFAVLADAPRCFVDPIHNDRTGYRRLAEAALAQLRSLGLLVGRTDHVLASAIDLATVDDRDLALGSGFWPPEVLPEGGGRWTEADAMVELDRRHDERTLLVDLTCFRPVASTTGVIEVNRQVVAELPQTNGRHRLRIDLSRVGERRVSVRFRIQSAYRPRDLMPNSVDSRELGVFLHQVRLEEPGDLESTP